MWLRLRREPGASLSSKASRAEKGYPCRSALLIQPTNSTMDILPEHDALLDTPTLSYDEDVVYEDQVQETPSLADRIGRAKVYLLSETNVTRGSKVRVAMSYNSPMKTSTSMTF
jgi:hypothetical protein